MLQVDEHGDVVEEEADQSVDLKALQWDIDHGDDERESMVRPACARSMSEETCALKAVVCMALYPQLALPDPTNTRRRDVEA